ncbi:hypothetical protein VZ94_13860 [Methylocucumis oryzae]|uniref:Uncharacterized protein n=1 Tax=Methylocucumis oryzae TaxID=1632867 RepID=A0A0F3IH31_9GAMM|nr:hypothetical protein VZ94_13860 [Methylocucumis oryzae]
MSQQRRLALIYDCFSSIYPLGCFNYQFVFLQQTVCCGYDSSSIMYSRQVLMLFYKRLDFISYQQLTKQILSDS